MRTESSNALSSTYKKTTRSSEQINIKYNIVYSIFLEGERKVMIQQAIGPLEKGSAVKNVLREKCAQNINSASSPMS